MSTADDDANQAAFEAAFAGTDPEPALAASGSDDATSDKSASAVQPDNAAQPEDPFAGLSPQVRDLLGTIPQLQAQAQANARLAGLVPGMQSRIDKLTAQQPAPSPPATAPRRFEAIDRVRNDLPDIADALDEIVRELPQRQEPQAQQPIEQPPERPASDPQTDVLDDLRPAWGQEISSTDYQLWLSTQAPEYRQSVQSTQKASVILKSLQHFDAHVEQTKATRQAADSRTARMASTVSPRGDGRRQTGAQPDNLQAIFEEAFARS